jgi:TPR repeat protein
MIMAMQMSLGSDVRAGKLLEAQNAFYRGDYDAALKLIRPLANEGDAVAQYNMGFFNFQGITLSQDDAAAAKWFRKSAVQGYTKAQCALAVAYGLAARQDHAEAQYSLAARRHGNANKQIRDLTAEQRDRAASKITPLERVNALQRAAEWKPE